MKISDLLSPTDVMIDVRASNKRLLLQEFAAKAADSLGLPVDQVAPYLLKREELGSTGIGHGVAIPHARLPDLQRPHGLLAKLKQPIEFEIGAKPERGGLERHIVDDQVDADRLNPAIGKIAGMDVVVEGEAETEIGHGCSLAFQSSVRSMEVTVPTMVDRSVAS